MPTRVEPRRLRQVLVVIALTVAAAQASPLAQTERPTEYQIKAAYLYNFTRFVTWPSTAPSLQANPVAICVLGDDPFGAVLDAAGRGLLIDGKATTVRRLTDLAGADTCRVLFVSESGGPSIDTVLATLGNQGVLTVSDQAGFTRRGGIIQFVLDGNRVRFEVNLAAAEAAGLTMSSELLKVAIAVRSAPRRGA